MHHFSEQEPTFHNIQLVDIVGKAVILFLMGLYTEPKNRTVLALF